MKKSVCMYIMLLTVMLLASCSGEKCYVNVLPEEPGVVYAFDLKQLVQKSELSAEDIRTLVDELKNTVGSGVNVQGTELLDKVFANPEESGLDLRQKVYLFTDTKLAQAGLLACVNDKAKLDELVGLLETQQVVKQVENKEGYRQGLVEKGLLAYSESSCLLLFSEMEAGLQKWASELMGQEGKGTFSQTKAFENMERMEGDISAYASMALLPDEYKTVMKASVPAAINWRDIDVVAGIHFEKGRMLLDMETVVSDEMKKEYEKIRPIYAKETSDRFLKLFPKDGFMWINMGLKGERLYEIMEKEPTMAAQLQSVQSMFDLKSLLGAIDGEVAFCISSVQPAVFAMLAEVKNTDFVKSFESLKPMLEMTGGQMKLLETGTNTYELQLADGRMAGMASGASSIYIGVKDNVFYLTNDKQCAEQKEADHSMKEAVWADHVSGKRCFMAMNWDALSAIVGGDSHRIYSSKDQIARMLLNYMDYITLEALDDTHGRIEVGMKDKETNVLKQWIGMGKQLSIR